MIEKIHSDDYNKLNINQRPPPDIVKYEINNQEGTAQKQLNNNPTFFFQTYQKKILKEKMERKKKKTKI